MMTRPGYGETPNEDDADELAYLEGRATWHQARADEAREDSTRAVHQKFSRLYKERASSRSSTFVL